MSGSLRLPIGSKVSLPGHFDIPVMLEDARRLPSGYECRLRLPDGTIDEAVISEEEIGVRLSPTESPPTRKREVIYRRILSSPTSAIAYDASAGTL